MSNQFIVNERGEKTAAIIPINEYENMLHQHHLKLELTDEYKSMIDNMLQAEVTGDAQFIPYAEIKNRFGRK